MTSADSLTERMEYAQDVAGWKSIIFLPFHVIWQVVMMVSILYSFVLITNMATYELEYEKLIYASYFCDCLFFTDVFCAILHHTLKDTRKLKNFQAKPWALVTVDCLSLIPFELIYSNIYIPQTPGPHQIWAYMFLNRTVRIYRIYYYFKRSDASLESIKFGYLFSYIELFCYGYCLSHVAACIFQGLKTDEELEKCESNRFQCMLLNEVNIFLLMVQRFVGNETTYNTLMKRVACCIFMTIGHFYITGLMSPTFIFSCLKRLRTFFEFWNRFKRLKIFVNNMIEDDYLKKKALDEFRTVWTYGKGNLEPEMLKTFPTNLRKNVYSDLYWDALRHSDLFQGVSYSCKRSLALKVVGDFYMPGTIFWDIGENKDCMLYLSSGILQIMAEENSKSPIVSFSGGTILGESTIYYPGRSKAILRVATFSEIHVLYAKDVFEVIKDYPKDRELIRRNLSIRIQIAKMTQTRKREISKAIFNQNTEEIGDFVVHEDDSVKWIKTKFRELAALQEVFSRDDQEHMEHKNIQAIANRLSELKTSIDHTSIYLPLLNLGEDIEVLTDLTCLKTSLPWVIDPTSHFSRLWRGIMLIFVLFCSVVYPAFVAWWDSLPGWLMNVSQFISAMYVIDIFMQLSTAVKTKDTVIVSSGAIFRYRLKSPSFYADVLSALPLGTILKHYWAGKQEKSPYIKISIATSLLRVYKLSTFLNEWCDALKGKLSRRVMFKYLFFYLLWIYWSMAIIHLFDVECLFWTCETPSWYNQDYELNNPQYRNLAAAFFTVNILLDVPDIFDYNINFPSMLPMILCLAFLQFMLMAWFGDYNAAYVLEMAQEIKFRNLLLSVSNFMNERNIIGRVKRRVMDTMFFQWHYDSGDYMTQERSMLEDAPQKLTREVNKSTIFKVMKSCEVLKHENEALVWYLCRRCTRLALPTNSILLTFGIQTMTLYIVCKGYLQVNSFLPGDILDGFATPILYGPGKILPLLVALNQLPSGLTVRTLTDCELIVINLEDFIAGLVLNNCFQDFVSIVKKIDTEPFRNAKLTISKVVNPFGPPPPPQLGRLLRLKGCGWILSKLLLQRAIRADGTIFLRWEVFRLLCFVIAASSWPIIFDLPITDERKYLIYFLLALDSFGWIDFYVRLHIGFYNEKGIYVTHPLSTAVHYLTTSFIIEFLAFLPYIHSLFIIARDPDFIVYNDVVVFHSLVRLFSLYRLLLFVNNHEDIRSATYIKGFGYFVVMIITVHCLVILKLRSEVENVMHPNGTITTALLPNGWIKMLDIPDANNAGARYILMLYCIMVLIFRSFPFFKDFNPTVLACEIIFPVIGMIIVFTGHAFFICQMMGAKMNFTIYQYHMKSFTHFLKIEKAEDSISTMAISHFEHEWEKKRGEDLEKVFSRFPSILEEDLMFPIYRKTLAWVPCFAHANEGFYRSLSRIFVEAHFRKGSTVMFQKSVHKDIYFVHKGQCIVENSNVILGRGSVLGDIKGEGITKSNIAARTHVVLLLIKSPEFFILLNNFYLTEAAFYDEIEKVGDFIQSNYVDRTDDEVGEVVTWTRTAKEEVECEFEMADDVSSTVDEDSTKKEKAKRNFFSRTFQPNSKTVKILRIIFVIDALLTAFIIPIIIALRLITASAFIAMYTLDAIWILKIVVTLRTAYVESETGNVVTNGKSIFKNYVRTSDGFLVDLLCVFPFEYVHLLIRYYYHRWSNSLLKYCFSFRLLRLLCLWISVSKETRKLSLGDRTRWLIIVMRQIITYNFLVALNLLVSTDEKMKVEDYQTEYSYHLTDALIWSYLSMINLYGGTGLYIFPPRDLWQVSFQLVVTILSVIDRSLLTSEVLSIINVSLYVKSENLIRMQLMEKYLVSRDISPALKTKLMSYAGDLLEHFNAEVVPWFLQQSPYYIRVQIMQDLYMQYLLKCYAFEGLPQDFLMQMAARMERFIYFPSDVITELGDVDNCIYFVHRGEVASIQKDPLYLGLDYEVNRYENGDYFGVEEGLHRSLPHPTTYRAITRVDLLSLNYFHWEDMRLAFPDVTKLIYEKVRSFKKSELQENPNKGESETHVIVQPQ